MLTRISKQAIMKVAVLLLVLGAALLGYASSLSPYTNEALYTDRYMELRSGQSADFFKLRDELLTPKFQLEDYGITLMAVGLALLSMTHKARWLTTSPKCFWMMVVISLALPCLSTGAYVFDLLQDVERGEFPSWADTLAIPMMAAPIIFIFALLWSLGHLCFLYRGYPAPTRLILAFSRKADAWLLIMSAISAGLLLIAIASGDYWSAGSTAVWLYFYLSICAVRVAESR